MKHRYIIRYLPLQVFLYLHVLGVFSQPICQVTKYDDNNGLSQWHVTQFLQDRNGMLWFSTWNGLNRFDGYDFECFKSEVGDGCGMTTDRIRNIWPADNGDIYCKVDEDIYLFDVRTGRFKDIPAEKKALLSDVPQLKNQSKSLLTGKNDSIRYRDRFGTLWCITAAGKISYQERESDPPTPYRPATTLDDIRFYQSDTQGNLWLLSTSGVYKLSFLYEPATVFPQEVPGQIRYFFTDQKGRYWITSREDATVRLFNSRNERLGYLTPSGTLSQRYAPFCAPVYCIMQSSSGALWLGSRNGGLFRLRETGNGSFTIDNFRSDTTAYALNNPNIYDIKEDRHGRLWLATLGGGINCLPNPEDRNPRFIHLRNGLQGYPQESCRRVRYLHICRDSILLAATTEGLLTYRLPDGNDFTGGYFRRHTKDADRADGISNSATMDILEDRRGRIFVSTESGGVNRILSDDLLADSLSFAHYNTGTGLPTDVALSLTEHEDRLWIVSSNRIVVLNPDDNSANSFDAGFFHRQCRFSDAHPMRLPDGRWIFGLQDGAFTITTDSMQKSAFVPPIALTGLSIQNKAVDKSVNHLRELILDPDERNFTLYFAALDYTDADRIEYAFRLGDDDMPWNYIRKGHSATFLDIAPGTYTLMIRSTNADGVWVDNIRTLAITVRPTFWETGWAILLLVILGLSAVAGITGTVRYIRRIKRQQQETLDAYLTLINKSQSALSPTGESIPAPPLNPEEELFMQRVMQFVEKHLDDPDINIGDMASAAATSRSGLNRKMKSILGVTPLEFLREARIQKAAKMLKETALPTSEIALLCGFADPKYFSRCFKTSTGASPSDYRNRRQPV